MYSTPIIKIFPSLDQLTEYFISRISTHFINKSADQFLSIALSGGSTPKAIFELIAGKYKNQIDWSKLLIFWSDERCVPPTDEESNYRMARKYFLQPLRIPESNIYRIKGENDPEDESTRYSEIVFSLLKKVNNVPQFDLIMLGLGADGHTASIFPNNIYLFNSDKLFELSEHPATMQNRITASGKLINNAREVCFIVTGSGKAEKAAQILNKKDGWEELPASRVDPAEGRVVWLLDEAAGSQL